MPKVKITLRPELTIGFNSSLALCTARFKELGLTAYGKTSFEARESLSALLEKFIDLSIADDKLQERLDHTGVDWSVEPLGVWTSPRKRAFSSTQSGVRDGKKGERKAP